MELFPKIANAWKLLTIFAKDSILDVWLGSESASVISPYAHMLKTLKSIYSQSINKHFKLLSRYIATYLSDGF